MAESWTPYRPPVAEGETPEDTTQSITFGGVTWRGRFKLKVQRTEEYEINTPKGQTGGTASYLGQREREISVDVVITDADEYRTWMEITQTVFAPPTNKQKPETVYVVHPMLNQYYGIFDVVLLSEDSPDEDERVFRHTASMRLKEVKRKADTFAELGAASNAQNKDAQLSPTQRQLLELNKRTQDLNARADANRAEAASLDSETSGVRTSQRGLTPELQDLHNNDSQGLAL